MKGVPDPPRHQLTSPASSQDPFQKPVLRSLEVLNQEFLQRLNSGSASEVPELPAPIHHPQEWFSCLQEAGDGTAKPDMDTIQAMRALVWRQTEQAVRDGGYRLPDGQWVRLHVTSRPSTCEYDTVVDRGDGDDLPLHQGHAGHEDSVAGHVQAPCDTISVAREDFLLRAMLLKREFGSVAVLNTAHPSIPGGNYRSGASTQEEDLYRRTDLWRYPSVPSTPSGRTQCWCPGV